MDERMQGILSAKNMSRMMFYEALVRIAFFKYKTKEVTETTLEGVKKLVEHLKARIENPEWMPWRYKKLWTLEVDDLYKANLVTMKKLWQYYFVVKKTKITTLEDVTLMMTKEAELNLLAEQV